MAKFDGCEISRIVRWGKNGKKYVWDNPTQEKLDALVKKHGCEQISESKWGNILWLNW